MPAKRRDPVAALLVPGVDILDTGATLAHNERRFGATFFRPGNAGNAGLSPYGAAMAKTDDAQTEVAAPEPFTVEKGILRAHTDMYWEYLEDFDAACRKLLEARRSQVEVDLTSVNFISSSFLGCLSNLVLRASRLRKRITLRVTLDVSWLFEIMGVQGNVELKVV